MGAGKDAQWPLLNVLDTSGNYCTAVSFTDLLRHVDLRKHRVDRVL